MMYNDLKEIQGKLAAVSERMLLACRWDEELAADREVIESQIAMLATIARQVQEAEVKVDDLAGILSGFETAEASRAGSCEGGS